MPRLRHFKSWAAWCGDRSDALGTGASVLVVGLAGYHIPPDGLYDVRSGNRRRGFYVLADLWRTSPNGQGDGDQQAAPHLGSLAEEDGLTFRRLTGTASWSADVLERRFG